MSRSWRIRLVSVAVGALLTATLPAAALAASRSIAYSAGTYSGKVTQVVPKPYAGRISFVVSKGQLTGLTLSFGVACQGIGWVHEMDPITGLTIGIGPTGGFSYVGKIDRSRLRISGILRGHTAVGSFFQSLWFGHAFCTMNRAASYTASS